jgi:predicted transcriptional regulator
MKTNTDKEELIIGLLANNYSKAILSLTSKKECSASMLSQELNIPLATVYRKLRQLEDTGLIQHIKTIINLFGIEEKFYRCRIREVKISINEGMFSVELTKEDQSDKIIWLWKRLAHPDNK